MPEITNFPGATAYDAKGTPTIPATFIVDPAPQFKAAWIHIAKMGNRVIGTTAERSATASWAWEGLAFYDTTEKREYVRRAGAWVASIDIVTPWMPLHALFGIPGTWPNLAGYTTEARREGNWVYIRGALSNTGNFTSFATAGTAPVGWRPDSTGGEYFQVLQGGSAAPKQVRVLSGGEFQVHSLGQTGAAWIFPNLRYYTTDPFPSV